MSEVIGRRLGETDISIVELQSDLESLLEKIGEYWQITGDEPEYRHECLIYLTLLAIQAFQVPSAEAIKILSSAVQLWEIGHD